VLAGFEPTKASRGYQLVCVRPEEHEKGGPNVIRINPRMERLY